MVAPECFDYEETETDEKTSSSEQCGNIEESIHVVQSEPHAYEPNGSIEEKLNDILSSEDHGSVWHEWNARPRFDDTQEKFQPLNLNSQEDLAADTIINFKTERSRELIQRHAIDFEMCYKHVFKVVEHRTDRLRRVVKPGWSSSLSHIMYLQLKIPCCISWKFCTVRVDDIFCSGSCTSDNCNAKFECIATNTNLSITIVGFDPNCPHDLSKKRRILSCEKAKYEMLLKGRSALEVRNELCDDLMDPYDIEPAILPSANALRKMKQRLDVPKENVVDSLLELKKLYPNTIGAIGLDPFFTHYSTELQRACYKIDSARRKPVISIDATGLGLVPPVKDQPTATHIFLYVMACHGKPKSFPVSQMITQSHTTESIEQWLKDWLKTNHTPGEIIMDESGALMSAAINIFTQYSSTNQYLDACMQCLLLQSDEALPRCYVRIDRSHFVKSIFLNVKKGLKQTIRLIRGVLGYLITCCDLKEAETIISNLFTVIFNEYTSDKVDAAYIVLLNLVRTHEGNDVYCVSENCESQEEVASNEEKIPKDKTYKSTVNYTWIRGLIQSISIAECNLDGSGNAGSFNAFYAPQYRKYLTRTFVRMPLWSNIMIRNFGSRNDCATSSQVESIFKDIKRNLCFKKRRVDLFLKRHIKYLSGEMKLVLANQEVSTKRRLEKSASLENIVTDFTDRNDGKLLEHSQSTEDVHDSEHIEFENWRNKGKTKMNNTDKNPRRAAQSILSKVDLAVSHSDIPLLQNGQSTKNIISENTCAFDSIYVVYAVAAADYNCLYVKNAPASKFSEFLSQVMQSFTVKERKIAYVLRNQIFESIFSDKYYGKSGNLTKNNKITHIDCHTGIAAFFSQLVRDGNEQIASSTLNAHCDVCEQMRTITRPLVPLSTNVNEKVPLTSIQSLIADKRPIHCQMCHEAMRIEMKLNDVIAFEVEPTRNENTMLQNISNVQTEITLSERSYTFFAAIEFKSAAKHFIVHVKRISGTWETYDDLFPGRSHRKFKDDTKNIFMIFYVLNKSKQ